MTAHEDVEPNSYVKQNFQTLLGKVFQPFDRRGQQQYFSLALRNPAKIDCKNEAKAEQLRREISAENDAVLFQLKQSFYVEPCALGKDPSAVLPVVEPRPQRLTQRRRLTFHYVENYADDIFLIGGYREDQRDWIFGDSARMVDPMYNVRLGKEVKGGINIQDTKRLAKFMLLYEIGTEHENRYRVFRIKGYQVMKKEELEALGYPNPQHDRYYCYVIDEEVAFVPFAINRIISNNRINHRSPDGHGDYPEGRPIFKTGKEMMGYLV